MKVILDFESGEAFEIEMPDTIAGMIKRNVPCSMVIKGDNAGKNVTGYERVEVGEIYFSLGDNGKVDENDEERDHYDDELYSIANYHSDETVAVNNARADNLYRQLRRFAVEHREKKIDWNDEEQIKYSIVFDNLRKNTYIEKDWAMHMFKAIYFDSEETAYLASETFRDELIWYFTEYKDSL